MTEQLFDIGLVLAVAAAFALVARVFKQSLILSYICAGIFVGALGFLVSDETHALLEFMGVFGVTFLLFLVGLELRFSYIKTYGLVSLLTGVGQIIFTSLIGFLLLTVIGFGSTEAFYVALALTFSSTIIVIKLLTEKRDLDSLYGRITIGFLLVQDAVAILALILVSGVSKGDFGSSGFVLIVAKALLFLGIILGLSKTLIPLLFSKASKSLELLFILSIAWMLLVASAATYIGLSLEIGAFLAGISLANLNQEQQIGSRVRPLRDLFIVFFFITLGLSLTLNNVVSEIIPILILSLFILIGNPLIILTIMGLLGFKKRTSFMASVTVAQISEFSLILVALGRNVGDLDQKTVDIVTAVGLITILGSSYMILYSSQIYRKLSGILSIFEKNETKAESSINKADFSDHVVLIGSGRLGFEILKQLQEQKFKTLVVDFNPAVESFLKSESIDHIFGDITDPDIWNAATIDKAKLLISTVFDSTDTLELLNSVKTLTRRPIVIVTAAEREWALKFYKLGADYVIVPRVLSGHQVAHLLTQQKLSDLQEGKLKREQLEILEETLEKISA